MREQLDRRLAELEREFSAGEQKLREIEVQQTRLRDTLLRIDGAMHVLRELLARTDVTEQMPGNAEDAMAMPDGNGAPIGVQPAPLARSGRGKAVA